MYTCRRSMPFPCGRLSRPLSTMIESDFLPVAFRPSYQLHRKACLRNRTRQDLSSPRLLLFPHATSPDPGRLSTPCLGGASVLASVVLNTCQQNATGIRQGLHYALDEADYASGATALLEFTPSLSRGPMEYPVYASYYCYQLLRKTRYWWVANPCQIKTR